MTQEEKRDLLPLRSLTQKQRKVLYSKMKKMIQNKGLKKKSKQIQSR